LVVGLFLGLMIPFLIEGVQEPEPLTVDINENLSTGKPQIKSF
jgi:hypothetical protein